MLVLDWTRRPRLWILGGGLLAALACDPDLEPDDGEGSDPSSTTPDPTPDKSESPQPSDQSPEASSDDPSDDPSSAGDPSDKDSDGPSADPSKDPSDDSQDSPSEDPEGPRGAFVTANLDDDNENGTADFKEGYFAQDNDIAPWVLPVAPKGEDMELRFSGAIDKLKIWRDGEDWMGQGQGAVKSSFRFASPGKDLALQVEMGDYNAQVTLEVHSPSRGVERYNLAASPLILNHHLTPYEQVWIVQTSESAPTVKGFRSALPDKLQVLSGSSYRNDIWLQDEIEFGTLTGMNGARIDVVMDSIRNRGLDAFPERELTGSAGHKKDWVLGVWGQGKATSGDSFGNLEASPPVTVDGVHYPFGRVYYGDTANGKLNSRLEAFLKAQEIQKPFGFDTSWLCVSHVDEIMTFVPDPSAPQGFLMLFADTRAGFEMLEAMDASAPLSRYRYRTVGDMRNDRALRDRNEEIQQDALDPTLARFKKELGLSDDEIILVPSLFHDVTGCRGPETAAALIPGTVNMVVLPGEDGKKTKLIIADPFFRRQGAPQSDDAFIKHFKTLMPDHLELHFADDWDAYHKKHGEVHCASNVKRPPAGKWWEPAKTTTPTRKVR